MKKYPFRRRCGWCGVPLRGWQLNLCQLCAPNVRDNWPSPPCGQAERWTDVPDSSKLAERWIRWWDERPIEAGVVCWTAGMLALSLVIVGLGFALG